MECGSHAIINANLRAYRESEWTVCKPLLTSLDDRMLCLADRGFNGYTHWAAAQATGAQLLWRCANNRTLPVVKALSDGSSLSVLYPSGTISKKQRQASRDGITVRVIDYALPNAKETSPRYRLLTTLLDEHAAPALELAGLYHQRWDVEAVFDELNIHLLQKRRVFRSKKADLVRQEFYGWVLAHYAGRWLMPQAASEHRLPDRSLSFTANVQLFRTAQPRSGAFSPSCAPESVSGGVGRY